jgi:hypothetical protein
MKPRRFDSLNSTARMTNRTASGIQSLLRFARPLAAVAVASSLFLVPKVASAQQWLKDRRYQEGEGIRAGDLELHPGIGGEVGYDSNWFLRSASTNPRVTNGNAVEGGIIRITPSLTLNTLSGARVEGAAPSPFAFTAGVAATYREFIGPQELRDQRSVSGNAFVRADINRGRPIGFDVYGTYQRLIQPSVLSNPNLSFNRSDVTAGADVIAIPGGGTLDLRAGYQFYGAFFEDANGVPYTNVTHEVSVRNRWRFRPRTALFHDTSLRFISYPNASRALNYLNDSTPLRTRFGVTGLLTDRFGVLLAAGYGATFFANPAATSSRQYDSLNAQAEGTFYLSQTGGTDEPGQATLLLSTFSFGYSREFQNSLLGNFYSSDKGYLKLLYFFGGKALLQLDGYVEALGFPQPFYNRAGGGQVAVNGANGTPTGDFTNIRAGGTLFGEYRFSSVFGLNATIDYTQMISDTQLEVGPGIGGAPPQLFDLSWRRVQALVGARLFW